MPRTDRRARLGLAAVALLGALAVAQYGFDGLRPPAAENRVADEIVVTSAADRGEGSLREAIFAAATATGRVRILVRTGRIALKSPLPPLVNPAGTVIQGETPDAQLDGTAVTTGPVLEVGAERSQVAGLAITGAGTQAILVRARGFRLTGARIADCAEGVRVTAGAEEFVVDATRFEDNGIGLRIDAPAAGMSIRDNQFARHREAGVWMVRNAEGQFDEQNRVVLAGNRFEGDRMSVVAGNVAVAIEKNEFVGARESAVYVIGRGVVVRGNQVRDGAGIGVLVQDAPRVLVENNDISRQQALGVLVRASAGATIHANRVHGNGYGMAFVLGLAGSPVMVSDNAVLGQRYDGIIVIGDSPVVRRNQSLNNGQVGLRILDFLPANAAAIVSAPFLDDNRSSGNRVAEVARGEYRAETAGGKR